MNTRNFHIQTFGCQMNANDSDWLVRSLVARGFTETPFEEASRYILNTCTVRDKPEQKVYSELGRIAHRCKVHKRENILVCVGGCVAQQVGEKLGKRFAQVRLIFGTDGVTQVPQAIAQLVESPRKRINLLDFETAYIERDAAWQNAPARASAFVNIMQGCNNFCTYCIVPFVRGRQKSRAPQAILEECHQLAERGTREITLLGQNVNAYGQDNLEHGVPFVRLLQQICAIPQLEHVRFVTSHPKDVPDGLIELFATTPKLSPRLHLPVQSGSDRILAAMNRKYTVEQYLRTVEKLKQARPDMLFSTDIIVGFPGETEEDFLATMDIMKEVGYFSSFSFIYSDRPKAKAVLLPNKIERSVALERLTRLQTWQDQHIDTLTAAMHGQTVPVLLEMPVANPRVFCAATDKKEIIPQTSPQTVLWQGQTAHDVKVHIELGTTATKDWTGLLLPVTLEYTGKQTLRGRKAGEPW